MEQKPAAPAPAPAATGTATSGGGGSTPPSAFPRLPVSSSSSFPTPTTMTTSTMTASSSSLSTSTVPRGGLSMGVPAHNPARTSQPFTTFGPSPPSSSLHQQHPHQFVSMHRPPDPSLSSTSQARAIGSFGSLGAGQLRPNSVPVSQSPRLAQTPLRPVPPPSSNPSFNSQRMATQGISRPVSSLPPPSSLTQLHMQASSMPPPSSSSYRPVQGQHRPFQAPLQHLQAPIQNPFPAQHSNPNPNRVPLSGPIGPLINADLAEQGNKIVSKRSIHELFSQIDPSENVEKDVEDILIEVAEDFVESLTTFACSLAKHRKSSTLEAKDILLHAERNWNITLPGFSGDDLKIYKKPNVNDIHRERLALIKKSMGDHRRTNVGGASQPATLTKL